MQACLCIRSSSLHRFLPISSRCASAVRRERPRTFFRESALKVGCQPLRESGHIATDRPSIQNSPLTTMAGTTTSVVEHVVLFKLKEDVTPEKSEAMMQSIRELKSLDGVLQITAGPALLMEGGNFTHALHGRYKDKAALAAYSTHPAHVSLVESFVKRLAEDVLALDWESQLSGEPSVQGGVGRITLMKVKEGASEAETNALAGFLNEYPSRFPGVQQVSFGPNFAPARSKGFNWGFWALFPSMKEVKEVDVLSSSEEYKALQESQITPLVDSFLVIDIPTGIEPSAKI